MNNDIVKRLRAPKILDAMKGATRPPSDLEIEAAGVIESLEFQLSARIEAARVEVKAS